MFLFKFIYKALVRSDLQLWNNYGQWNYKLGVGGRKDVISSLGLKRLF